MFQVLPPSVLRYQPDISQPTKRRLEFTGEIDGAYSAPPPPIPTVVQVWAHERGGIQQKKRRGKIHRVFMGLILPAVKATGYACGLAVYLAVANHGQVAARSKCFMAV